jgi:O-antigen/teichoic acid export membrane protein
MNGIFFLGSLFVSFLNYLYYPVLGRMLSAEQFGELQVLVSFYLQATIFLNVLALVIVNLVTQSDTKSRQSILNELERLAYVIGAIEVVAITLISSKLANALQFADGYGFIVMAVIFFVSIPLTFKNAYLRGVQDFFAASMSGVVSALAKIVLSVLFVYVGWKTFGAVAGILLAQFLALAYAAWKARVHGFGSQRMSEIMHKPNVALIRPQLRFISFVFVVSLVVTVLFSIDVALVKYFFSPQEAGAYAGISTIARIIYFLTASIAIVLLSTVNPAKQSGENRSSLQKSVLLTAALGAPVTAVFFLFPEFVTHLLMGTKFDAYTHLLPILSVTMLVISLANVYTNYHLAMRHYAAMYAVGVVAVTTGVLVILRHASIDEIVQNLLMSALLLLILLMLKTGTRPSKPV